MFVAAQHEDEQIDNIRRASTFTQDDESDTGSHDESPPDPAVETERLREVTR